MNALPEDFLTRRRSLLAALALVGVTFALFSPAIGYDFLNYDDDAYVMDNPAVQNGLGAASVRYAFTTWDMAQWAPLSLLSLMADTTLLGPHASSYHTTNILLHTAAGVMLFFALARMLKSFWPALVIAAVFLLHPLRTECVAWITKRNDVLFAAFWSLGLLLYERYARRPSAGRYAFVFACFLCGMMSKVAMVTFPGVLLLLDFWPLQRMSGVRCRAPGEEASSLIPRTSSVALLLEKLPFLVAGLVLLRSILNAVQAAHSLHPVLPEAGSKLLRVLGNYVFYTGKWFWPWPRNILHPPTPGQLPLAIAGAALLVGVTVFALRRMWRMPWLLVGWLWFIGTLAPFAGFATYGHMFVSERYVYIPSIGLAIMVVCGAAHAAARFPSGKRIAAAAGAAVIAACAAGTAADLPRWKDSVTLFADSVRVGQHHVAYGNLASALCERGDYEAAAHYAKELLALRPDDAGAYHVLGLIHLGKGELEGAIADFSTALQYKPDFPEAWNNRGNAYSARHDLTNALADFTKALELNPDYASALNGRAFVWCSLGETGKAIADCDRAIALNPRSVTAFNSRGNIYSQEGAIWKALADFDRVIELAPQFASAYNNRAAAWLALKEYDHARADVKSCCQHGGVPSAELIESLNAAVGSGK